MDLMNDFFHDYNEIKTLLRAGVHIFLLGHRLGLLFKKEQSRHLFMLIVSMFFLAIPCVTENTPCSNRIFL
jgi:hypothetical protein